MLTASRIDPLAVYDDGALRHELGLSSASLSRARRAGHLRYSRQGRRVIYLGSWLLAWLESDAGRSDIRTDGNYAE
jgi:hypothetical protein